LPDSTIMQRSLKHWQLASSQGRFKCPNRATSEKRAIQKKNAPRYFGGTSSSVPNDALDHSFPGGIPRCGGPRLGGCLAALQPAR
jgi:hypothetical protein